MSAYAALAAIFLGVAALSGVLLSLLAAPRERPRPGAVIATAVVLLALTAVFDSLMIAAGLFHYAPELLHGARIWLAPVEDFAYPLAGALLLPALWALLRSRRRPERAAATTEDRS
ncbi:lycopene cyclase domain-containing protein [Streptomyces sp. AC495_CC817]|uniref:lycopene cyclase domain-containing protein n=1 Tax=Streptomyces sp. AC495_CC817 TaxID=2823900 RepID=UPI0027E08926|nr:lycopene cyclase domain-containing protein [Streptomyces sp. AC495_CC817]